MNSSVRVSYLSNVNDTKGSSANITFESGNQNKSIKNYRTVAAILVGIVFVLLIVIVLVYFLSTKEDEKSSTANKLNSFNLTTTKTVTVTTLVSKFP